MTLPAASSGFFAIWLSESWRPNPDHLLNALLTLPSCQRVAANSAFVFPSITSRASYCGFDRATALIPCTKSNTLSGGRPSSARTVATIRPVSAFENPRLRRKSCLSSSDRATIFSRAAQMPSMKGAGKDSAKRLSAGVAS